MQEELFGPEEYRQIVTYHYGHAGFHACLSLPREPSRVRDPSSTPARGLPLGTFRPYNTVAATGPNRSVAIHPSFPFHIWPWQFVMKMTEMGAVIRSNPTLTVDGYMEPDEIYLFIR